MPLRPQRSWVFAALLLSLATVLAQPSPGIAAAPSMLDLKDVGKGAVPIDGSWLFQTGDNPSWSSPALDDSSWSTIRPDEPWGLQGHPAYSGFAWYRRHIRITAAPGETGEFLILMPAIDDAYQVFWNGIEIGHIGTLPPRASWPATRAPHIFSFPGPGAGVLAVRVWKDPPGSSDSGAIGGFRDTPMIGNADSIQGQMAISNYANLLGNAYSIGINLLYGLVSLIVFIAWFRNRQYTILLWFAIFTGCPSLWGAFYTLRMPIDATVASGLLQPLFALRNIALWYLLLELLQVDKDSPLRRWARVLAIISIACGTLDGVLNFLYYFIGWYDHPWIDITDAILTTVTTAVEVFPLVIVALAIRRKLSPERWAVASAAFFSHMLLVVTAASQQGQRFTHWSISNNLSQPLFSLFGTYFTPPILADTILFIAILYALYRYGREQSRKQSLLAADLQRAREIQQALIPEAIPPIEGFTITSAYQPAQDVGGDFFQVIPCEDGSILIALGDVSGKGLQAAMSVSMILGILRTLADSTNSPAEILSGLNRRMYQRIGDGFATAIVARASLDGNLTFASAGHLPPYLNGKELQIPGSLPLGVVPDLACEEVTMRLSANCQLTLYTDGLLEARNGSGELYGFARLNTLFASRPSAEDAAQAAVRFGQEDDITVLTLNRSTSQSLRLDEKFAPI
ncbi:SpoIIE family protein phosphatase [Acidicapsa dinghuensis]|uniref:SpoIIE family protein phosphatase n=1 Tax=Acidicapsa dinghuensis TaxID=2218256 RepID=A0ABW1EGV7_9BACT|nr:PP2C family protein-serine/threonine phosphatase [Acidicapsa dinghuensis]